MRSSSSVNVGNYYTPSGVHVGANFTTGSINADTEIGVMLHPKDITSRNIYFQFVCLFTDFYGVRKLRVINLVIDVVQQMSKESSFSSLEIFVFDVLITLF